MLQKQPILVTGAAGRVGAVGRTLSELLLARGLAVRALVRREDDRSASLRRLGAQVVVGDLLDLHDLHRAIDGCAGVYFALSVSASYLEATVNAAVVAKHHGVRAFVNMSQMTVSQMSISETTPSPQQKQHWLGEQVLNWSGLPLVHVRPTVFMEVFFLRFSSPTIRQSNEILLPFGNGRTSPIAAQDVARALADILSDPAPHIGRVYNLTGPQSEDMHFYAKEYSEVLGRHITYIDVPLAPWRQRLIDDGLPNHVVEHLSTMALLHQQNRYDRMSDDVRQLTGTPPINIREFVRHHADAFGGISLSSDSG